MRTDIQLRHNMEKFLTPKVLERVYPQRLSTAASSQSIVHPDKYLNTHFYVLPTPKQVFVQM